MSKELKPVRVKLSELSVHPDNPRFIRDEKFDKLVKSLEAFPEMTEARPLVTNSQMQILGGNMRFRAMLKLGWTDCLVYVTEWDEARQREFIIKDNASFGEWDWDVLANEWNANELVEWGLDTWNPEDEEGGKENDYSVEVKAPVYECKGDKPKISEMIDETKTLELIAKIRSSSVDKETQKFLIEAAKRHTVFRYDMIAEFYAHADKELQELMEDSALVIIDFDKAIEEGYVRLTDELIESYQNDKPETYEDEK